MSLKPSIKLLALVSAIATGLSSRIYAQTTAVISDSFNRSGYTYQSFRLDLPPGNSRAFVQARITGVGN